MPVLFLFLALTVFLITQSHAVEFECNPGNARVAAEITNAMRNNPLFVPAFVRAAFHDCITATNDNPISGCNGSLRLREEKYDPRNDQLHIVTDLLATLVPGTCLSYADAIQTGMTIAINVASGGTFPNLNIRKNILDTHSPDTLTDLPDNDTNFTTLNKLFLRKGFNTKQLIASILTAHSLERFFNGQQKQPNFTTPFVYSVHYATILVQRIASGLNLQGFPTIGTDTNMLMSPEAVRVLKFFAGETETSNYDPEKGLQRLTKSLVSFLEKNSFLTGASLPQGVEQQ